MMAKLTIPGLVAIAVAVASCGLPTKGRGQEGESSYKVSIDVAPVPARYAAAWPSTLAGLSNWPAAENALPFGHARDELLRGDASLFERLDAASRRVTPEERIAWVRRLHQQLEFAPVRPAFCDRARPVMAGPPSALRDSVSKSFATECGAEADWPLIARDDTPSGAVIGWFSGQWEGIKRRPPPYDPRFEAAVREEFGQVEHPFDRQRAFAALLGHADPRAESAAVKLYRELPDGDERIRFALMLKRGKSAEAKAIGAAICNERPNSQPCEQDRASREMSAQLRAKGIEVYDGDSEAPEIADQDEAARPDPPAAVQAMAQRLVSFGFAFPPGYDPAQSRHADALRILGDAGLVHGFDVETGQFPNEHDSLMRELAQLTGGAFDGAVFEEVPPRFDPDAEQEDEGPYRLAVYLGGKRYRIEAENHGDWYDVEAVLLLLNAVLADRGAPLRLHPTDSEGQVMLIVAARPDAFDRATRAGLFEPGDPEDAERAGKSYEESVLGER